MGEGIRNVDLCMDLSSIESGDGIKKPWDVFSVATPLPLRGEGVRVFNCLKDQ